jgi:hypothetical protein
MSESKKDQATEAKAEVVDDTAAKKDQTLVDTIFDVGTAWAEYGLDYGKFALESSAKALTRTATALATLKEKLKRDETHKAA